MDKDVAWPISNPSIRAYVILHVARKLVRRLQLLLQPKINNEFGWLFNCSTPTNLLGMSANLFEQNKKRSAELAAIHGNLVIYQ